MCIMIIHDVAILVLKYNEITNLGKHYEITYLGKYNEINYLRK